MVSESNATEIAMLAKPKPAFTHRTIEDLAAMVFESNATEIDMDMLAKIKHGCTGAALYYPTASGDQTVRAGKFEIKLVSETDGGHGLVIRELELRDTTQVNLPESLEPLHAKGGIAPLGEQAPAQPQRTITHFHYGDWPNYGIPKSTIGITHLVRTLDAKRSTAADRERPLVVHCSGGVGRSGTLVAAYTTWWRHRRDAASLYASQPTDVAAAPSLVPVVKMLREMRHPWMVEGFEQYSFANDVLSALLKDLG